MDKRHNWSHPTKSSTSYSTSPCWLPPYKKYKISIDSFQRYWWSKNPAIWLLESLLGHNERTRFFPDMLFLQYVSKKKTKKEQLWIGWQIFQKDIMNISYKLLFFSSSPSIVLLTFFTSKLLLLTNKSWIHLLPIHRSHISFIDDLIDFRVLILNWKEFLWMSLLFCIFFFFALV